MSRVILYLSLVAATVVLANTEAMTSCSTDNDCFFQEGKPNCVEITAGHHYCVACRSNADCGRNEYCVKYSVTGKDKGSCLRVADSDRIGDDCIDFDPNVPPVFGDTDRMVCADPVYTLSGEFMGYNWRGVCVRGKCQICASGQEWAYTNDLSSTLPDDVFIYPELECIAGEAVYEVTSIGRVVAEIPRGGIVFICLGIVYFVLRDISKCFTQSNESSACARFFCWPFSCCRKRGPSRQSSRHPPRFHEDAGNPERIPQTAFRIDDGAEGGAPDDLDALLPTTEKGD